jgi:hypothetical protein
LYRDGVRTHRRLATELGVSIPTAKHLIERGYPKREWPSLKERARLYDAHKREADDRASAEKARAETDERLRAKTDNLKLTKLVKAAVAAGLRKVLNVVDKATFEKTVRGEKVVEGKAVLDALRSLASSLKDVSGVEEVWSNVEVDGTDGRALPGWATLSEEQAQYIIDHDGQLPDGVDDAMLMGGKKRGA